MLNTIYNAQTDEKTYEELPDVELPITEQPPTTEERVSDLELLVLELGGII